MDAGTSGSGLAASHRPSATTTEHPRPLPNSSSLNVIALISGGKDSLFSILHCLANGHTITALANLHPRIPTGGIEPDEDINSYMYQTVGHTVIPLYQEALGIPLYRQEIVGSAVNTDRDYAAPQDAEDETESLIPLLRKVLAAHPHANAISTGAILSTYQRTRVESVALRLGLIPLSYLWQYPLLPPYSQSALLTDMAAVGQDARIIKVASGGLDESFLWENVAHPRTIARLKKAASRFGGNGDGAVLGEGGEYETLAIDGPSVLWKKRIAVEADGVELGEGGTAIFRGKEHRTLEKDHESGATGMEALRIADLWDDEFKQLLPTLSALPQTYDSGKPPTSPLSSVGRDTPTNIIHSTPSTLTLSNLTADPSISSDPSSQLLSILTSLSTHLAKHNLSPSSISHTTLLLRDISTFTTLNKLYSTLFPAPNPPSRVTIACGPAMPKDIHVQLSAIIPLAKTRKGLHVQSRSYWAPANIGPYSQAITSPLPPPPTTAAAAPIPTPEIVYVAGQIPLVPSSMAVHLSDGFAGQTLLALQHLWRVARAVHVQFWSAGLCYVSSCAGPEAAARVRIAQEAWRLIHSRAVLLPPSDQDVTDSDDQDAHVDPWDLRNRVGISDDPSPADDATPRAPIPDPKASLPPASGPVAPPPCFVVQVSGLPRGVDVEWHSTGVGGGGARGTWWKEEEGGGGVLEVAGTRTRFVALELEFGGERGVRDVVRRLFGAEEVEWEHATLYMGGGGGGGWEEDERVAGLKGVLQRVHCLRVWGAGGREVDAVLVGRVTVAVADGGGGGGI